MRILAIQPFLGGWTINPLAGGKNLAAYLLARETARVGHEIFVLPWWGERLADEVPFKLGSQGETATALPTLTEPPLREILNGLPRLIARMLRYGGGGERLRNYLDRLPFDPDRALAAAMDRVRPDVVHVHQTHSDAADAYRRGGYDAPLVLTHYTRGVSESIPLFDEVVFVSVAQRQAACARHPELADRFRLIHLSVGEEFFGPLDVRPNPSIVVAAVLGSIGRDRHQKGVDLLLQAMVEYPSLRRFDLAVIGEGKHRDEYEATAQQHDLPVTFPGRISTPRLVEHFAAAGAFVMPSRGEGLATVYLEALCMGLPIVGFPPNVDELSEVLGMPVGVAYDAAAGDLKVLAEAIETVLDPDGTFTVARRRELAHRARQKFRLRRFLDEYHDLYGELTGNSRTRTPEVKADTFSDRIQHEDTSDHCRSGPGR